LSVEVVARVAGEGPQAVDRAAHKSLTEAERRETTLVFDASGRVDPSGYGDPPTNASTVNDIEVLYASEHAEADDLLEELIRRAPQPKLLRVVSSDQRIRRCARARRAESLDSEAFLQEMENREKENRQSQARGSRPSDPSGSEAHPTSLNEVGNGEGTANLSEAEVDYWLREFGQGDGI
jgi:predicted RNA-binding protein with PIN domain